MKKKNYFIVATPILVLIFCTVSFILFLVFKQNITTYWLFSLGFILFSFYKKTYEIEINNSSLKIYKRLFYLRFSEKEVNITDIIMVKYHISSDGFSGYGIGGSLRTTDNYKLYLSNKETNDFFEENGNLDKLNEIAFFTSDALSIKIKYKTINIDNTNL